MKSQLFSIALAALISTIIVLLVNSYAPRIEGRFLPVANAFDVDVTPKDRLGEVVVSGYMKKFRDCEFLGMKAYIGDPEGDRAIAPLDVKEAIRLRDEGDFPFGPWVIKLPFWQSDAMIRVITTHRCHPFWRTETTFMRVPINFIEEISDHSPEIYRAFALEN